MKKLICGLLTMVLLLGCASTVKGYAATAEGESGVQEIVSEYMELRFSNMQEELAAEDWNGIAVAGIVRDEALYASNLEKKNIQVLDTEYDIISVEGTEIVYVEVLETMKFVDSTNVEVTHRICIVQTKEGKNIIVSDEYNDSNSEFASCSYVDETALVEPCAFAGSSLCIIEVAKNEEGYCEKATNDNLDDKTANAGSGNFTKYGEWYGVGMNDEPWCAMFVSWCAEQAHISTNIIPKVALTENGMASFQSWGRFEDSIAYGGNYTPQPGDIFYLSSNATDTYHTGIVVSVSGNTMKCIEGNTENNKVEYINRSLTASSLRGFGTPAYVASTHTWISSGNVETCSICGAINYITIN